MTFNGKDCVPALLLVDLSKSIFSSYAMRPVKSWTGIFLVWCNQVFTRINKNLTKVNTNCFFRFLGIFIVTSRPLKGETREKYLSYTRQLLGTTKAGICNEALSACPGKQNKPFEGAAWFDCVGFDLAARLTIPTHSCFCSSCCSALIHYSEDH